MNQSYCLNLHERYAPEWGVWECARELFANAKDAAPDDLTLSSPNANTLEIHTPTVPDIAELFIIGCGSKRPDDANIGQFGEGLKLAALAATRKPGGSLTVRLPDQTITFSLKDHFGQQVLFADVAGSEPFEGCQCTLVMEGAGFALNGKIIEGQDSHIIPKAPDSATQIFSKGIWICALTEKQTIHSYNLNGVTLNRDRSHADPYSIKYSVGQLLIRKMTDVVAERLIQNPRSWESDLCLSTVVWACSATVKDQLANALFRIHGKKAVIATDPALMQKATDAGFKAVILGSGLADLLVGRVPLDTDVLNNEHKFELVPFEAAWSGMLAELLRLSKTLGFRSVNVKVFADQAGEVVGRADTETNTVWMNERLWNTDNRFERIRTFVHELAHLQSGGGDATAKFEASLDLIGGKLALLVLDSEIGILGGLEVEREAACQ